MNTLSASDSGGENYVTAAGPPGPPTRCPWDVNQVDLPTPPSRSARPRCGPGGARSADHGRDRPLDVVGAQSGAGSEIHNLDVDQIVAVYLDGDSEHRSRVLKSIGRKLRGHEQHR